MWRFTSRGSHTEFKGTWDSTKELFNMTSFGTSVDQNLSIQFRPDGSRDQRMQVLKADRGTDLEWSLKRHENAPRFDVRWADESEPDRITNGMKFLVQHTGEWERREYLQSEARWQTYDESVNWILNGQFIESCRTHRETGQQEYSVCTLSEEDNRLRLWDFSRDFMMCRTSGYKT